MRIIEILFPGLLLLDNQLHFLKESGIAAKSFLQPGQLSHSDKIPLPVIFATGKDIAAHLLELVRHTICLSTSLFYIPYPHREKMGVLLGPLFGKNGGLMIPSRIRNSKFSACIL
jgi:hypothetical protein